MFSLWDFHTLDIKTLKKIIEILFFSNEEGSLQLLYMNLYRTAQGEENKNCRKRAVCIVT